MSASQLNRSERWVWQIGTDNARAVTGVTNYRSTVYESFGLVAKFGVARRDFGGPIVL